MKKEVSIRKFMVFALLSLLLAGCAGNGMDDTDEMVYNPKSVIAFTTSIDDEPVTRGTPLNSASEVTSLGLFCTYTGKEKFNTLQPPPPPPPNKMINKKMNRVQGTDGWEYDGADVMWDNTSAADNYTFFAYAPYSSPANGITIEMPLTTLPRLRYKVPANVADQPDLMIAESRRNIHPTGHPVDLKMKHILTAVGFTLQGNGQVVTGLSLTGVYTEGVIIIDLANNNANTWISVSGETDIFNIPIAGGSCTATATEQDLIADDGYLMMINQQLLEAAKVIITFANNQTKEIKLKEAGNPTHWIRGQKITYKIILP